MVLFGPIRNGLPESTSSLSSIGSTSVIPVAVIGMACRLPGGIDSPEQLWEALLRGDDLVTEIPPDRWDVDEYYDPQPGVPGRSVCKWGAFLDGVADFDPEFFGITEKEAAAMDPQHRLLLTTSWEAMEHGGLTPQTVAGSRTGVFMGLMHDDYQFVHAEANELQGPYGYMGNSFAMGSGRIAYAMGLRGPAMTVDTACSSGLAAVHLACRSLHEGESDAALAGGASLMFEPRKAASGSAIGMLSATGRCHAFDVAADGFVAGEGCVVLLLKRLPDALADGDRILAVLRGTAANQDGHTVNIVTPSQAAQVEAYRTALSAAGVDASSVGMVEAHGPGTPVGDPIEYAGLAQVYGLDGPCALASVKTNFGHTQSAAGALGLMKAVLALQHGVIPRNLHFTRLPDGMARIDTNLFVPQENTSWPRNGHDGPRRAAVSSYGFSGTNVHAIVEQAPSTAAPGDAPAATGVNGPLLFPLSATSPDGLRQTAGRLADWIHANAGEVAPADLAYTLTRRRAHRPVRTAVFANGLQELAESLRSVADGDFPYQTAVGQDDRGPVWVFSGQGSQWSAMGAELIATEPVFAATVAEAEPLIAREAGFSVTEAISAAETVRGIDQIQPALFTMQVALAATMLGYGVQPAAVVGHSMGEVAAAVVAGVLSLEDGVRVICRRSRLMSTIAGSGAMASVQLPAKQVLTELMGRGVDDVAVAVVASPQSTVIGGAGETVRELVAAWEQRDILAREVAVDVASHSPQVDSILDELVSVLDELEPMAPKVPFYSSTLFDPREEPDCDAWYWADNLRHTVRFAAAIQAALEDGHRVFAELAPHPLLTYAVEQTAQSLSVPAVALCAMRREHKFPLGVRNFLADLYSAGAAIDFSVLSPGGRLVDAPLPAWNNRPLLLARDGQGPQARGGHTVAVHPLMGAHVRLQDEPERHVWQGDVGTAAQPWLGDHQIAGETVFPAAAYCEMALAAADTVLGEKSAVWDIRFGQTLALDDETSVGAVATVEAPEAAAFTVETNREGRHLQLASASLRVVEGADQPPAYDMTALRAAHSSDVDLGALHNLFAHHDVQNGPAFSGLIAARIADGPVSTALAEVALPGSLRSQQRGYGIHPALLDACFQSIQAHPDVQKKHGDGLLVPIGAQRIRAYAPARTAQHCYTRVIQTGPAEVEADVDVLDAHGTVLLAVRGLRLGIADSERANRDRLLSKRLLTIEWQRRLLPEADFTETGTWLLISTSTTAGVVATRLTDALKLQGAHCTTMCWPRHAQHVAAARELQSHLAAGMFTGVVVLTGPKNGHPEDECARLGVEYVQHVMRIARELLETGGMSPRLYVLTRNAQKVLADDWVNLEQGGLRGLLRVIGSEHPHLRTTHIDVDELTDAEQVAHQLLGGSDEDETAWRNGHWHTARLNPSPLRPGERRTTDVDHAHDGMRLQIRTAGDLDTMELAAFERIPPGPGLIEVAVTASGVNFTDVLMTVGRHPAVEGHPPPLGTDFVGVVTAVGPDVTNHRVGDRVGGFAENGCWATFVTCDAQLAVTLPPGLTDEQAAAVTTAHAIAWYGLHEQARIAAGDRVLIHSGTGGVGQAAIAIARAAGAQIFVTAGTRERRKFLHDMGIAHAYDSHSTDFAAQIRRDTDGDGVDVVLNSLTGGAQRAGLELLTVGGRFVEIGKSDVSAGQRLELPFRRNLTLHYLDLALMAASRPKQVADLLAKVYQLIADGDLPVPQSTRYPLGGAARAIRSMSAANHIGKLVLDVPRTGHSRVVVPPEQAPAFRRDGSYIITGGLGGLGLFLAEKMSSAGCGRIVLSSRSVPDQRASGAIELIQAMGGDIVVECGNIAAPGTADRLVAAATATGLPLRGVLHAAAVVEDAMLANITDELLERDWAPKAYGAWNLHEATVGQPLDWFCSFSSAAALVGSPGQGAYAAANSWLDAFTHWRRFQGLPSTAIAWGAWAEVGRGAALAESSGAAIAPEEGAHAFEALLSYNRAYSGYTPIVGVPWMAAYAERSQFFESLRSAQSDSGASKFRAELEALPPEEWPAMLRRMVTDQVTMILRRTIDPDLPLSEYGLDSLGNLELRSQIKAETGIRIAATDITTIRGLVDYLCQELALSEAASASS